MPSKIESAIARGVGRRIAELRRAHGWTQERLAEAADISLRHVQSVEGGTQNMTILSLERFAELLGVRVPDLFRPPRIRTVKHGRPRGTVKSNRRASGF